MPCLAMNQYVAQSYCHNVNRKMKRRLPSMNGGSRPDIKHEHQKTAQSDAIVNHVASESIFGPLECAPFSRSRKVSQEGYDEPGREKGIPVNKTPRPVKERAWQAMKQRHRTGIRLLLGLAIQIIGLERVQIQNTCVSERQK